MSYDDAMEALSSDALKLIKNNQIIGLGSGRAATSLVKSLAKLIKLKNIIFDVLDAKTKSLTFETETATRVYLWVSPCDLEKRTEETEGEVVEVAVIRV